MTRLNRPLILFVFLAVWNQGEGGRRGGGGEEEEKGGGGGGAVGHHYLHHHHHYHDLQIFPRDSYLLERLMETQVERGERGKNLVIPPVPQTPSHLKLHTWPRKEEEEEGVEVGIGNLNKTEIKKMKEEERRIWKRMKKRRMKLKRVMREELKRRKRQMRLTSKRKRGSEKRPNIVVIVADDLGYNDVPWHNPDILAPELQRLARHGVVLENHYVLPVCSPSRAALLTGRYPFRYGKQASFTPLSPTGLNTSLTLLPQDLQRLGYKTHLVGKWHLGYCNWAYTPTYRGFDSFYGFYLGGQGYYSRYKRSIMPLSPATTGNEVAGGLPVTTAEGVDGSGGSAGVWGSGGRSTLEDFFSGVMLGSGSGEGLLEAKKEAMQEEEPTDGGYDFRLNEMPLDNVTGVYSNDLYAARVEEVIRSHVREGAGSPLFLLLSLQATHGPLEAPPESCGRRAASPRHVENPARRTFHDMVAALDCVVGRLVRQLRRSRLYHNTLIVFTADNGGNFRIGGNNFPLRGGKGSVFEGGTKGVSFLHSPLLPHVGHRYRGLMHIVDWRATLLHAAKGPAHWPARNTEEGNEEEEEEEEDLLVEDEDEDEEEGEDSVDMWGALLHNRPSPRTSFVYNLRKGPLRGAIRRRHWKLVVGSGGRYDGWVPPEDVGGVAGVGGFSWHTPATRQPHAHHHLTDVSGSEEVSLFNLRDDPLETTDLSRLYPEVVASLRAMLKAHSRDSMHPHSPRDDPRGHPSLHGGFFSPGWCDPVV